MNPHESPTSTQPSPDERFRRVRILFHHIQSGDLLGAGQPLGHRRAVGNFGRKHLVGRARAGPEEIIGIAHARRCSPRRSTAECARTTNDSTACGSTRSSRRRRSRRAASRGSGPRSPPCGNRRIRLAELEPRAEQASLAGGVDDHLRPDNRSAGEAASAAAEAASRRRRAARRRRARLRTRPPAPARRDGLRRLSSRRYRAGTDRTWPAPRATCGRTRADRAA